MVTYYFINNDGESDKPFDVGTVKADSKEKAIDKLIDMFGSCFMSCWVLTKREYEEMKKAVEIWE